MKVELSDSHGNIVKTATIDSDDPDKPLVGLKLEGIVKAIVTMKPSANVVLRGSAGSISESSVDLEATTTPFHIESTETNLSGKINYSLQTVSDGTHYRLKVSNLLPKGSYSGFIRLKTDLPKAPYLLVRVMGVIKGEIAATPETVIIGMLSPGKPVRTGSVSVTRGDGKPFSITGLSYDKSLLSVSRKKVESPNGYVLNIEPKLDGQSPGSVKQAPLTVETNAVPGGKVSVLVLIFNNSGGANTKR
ncbi:MAG: hypothetical protein P4L43_02285 [Syntrophobacteraceae bacterium]|nr:hypothetical protein [Syntrophobacteraceae bacterium]